ncbi:MAG TPA: Gfo/Idh/MocA family oxidoreductase [Blastocatellia bacterium]|nr:Gfo/Idh/MocA family oxidoreductase [Blastocatellia bacterium]
MMTTHFGILGGGNISRTHASAAREIEGGEVVAVCGQNKEKVDLLARECSATPYHDIDAFLLHEPMEVVLVGSPSGLHAAHGIQAAGRGKHVLVEKPIDVATGRADELIAECERHRVKLGVFFQDRTAPDLIALKRLIDSGSLGRAIVASAGVKWYRPAEYYSGSRWRGTWALDGGGALINQGIHTVDLLIWLMGNVRAVSAITRTASHKIEAEDLAVAILEFDSGAIGTLEASTCVYPGFARRLELTWTEGTVVVENDRIESSRLRNRADAIAAEPQQDERASSHVVSDTRGHRAVIEDFLISIRDDRVPLCDGSDARRSLQVVEGIYQSSRTGERVVLSAETDAEGVADGPANPKNAHS